MTVAVLVLLAGAALTPLLDRPLRRLVSDPVLLVAALSAALLGAAAAVAVGTGPGGPSRRPGGADATGWADAAGWAGPWDEAAAAALGVLAAVTAGSHVVRAVFRLTRGEVRLSRPARGGSVRSRGAGRSDAPLELESPGSVLRGGAWIGYLERGAVAASLVAGFPEGVALVLAVKGVGRYPELRDSGGAGRGSADAPEEFIIGTLSSLLWAAAAAGTARLLR